MNETTVAGAPKWFKISSIILLIWNLAGLAMFGMMMSMIGNEEALTKMFPDNPKAVELSMQTPMWVNIAFAIAVICGTLGCAALVMRKKLAVPLLILSMLGVLAQNAYMYLLSDTVKHVGVGITPAIILIAIALIPFSLYAAKQGWLK